METSASGIGIAARNVTSEHSSRGSRRYATPSTATFASDQR
jgi:hypothetical protein